MNLFDMLRPECILLDAKLGNKQEALGEIARLSKKSDILKNVGEEDILESLKQREELGSTGFGEGIAIPHCRLDTASDFVVGIITVPSGVEFNAVDAKPVKLLVFIIAPARETNEHLRVLSAISHILRIPGSLDEFLAAESPQALWESFLRYARDSVDTREHSNKHLIHLFVQEENLFRKLLDAFADSQAISVTVIESKNTREYLSKMPLFAGLWSDSHVGFSRIIAAVAHKTMTNEIIRRIENVTGCLDDCKTVMVTIQEIFYAAGSLEA